MKKTNNRLVTNEAAVMPSYFKSLKTTDKLGVSHEVPHLRPDAENLH